MIQCSFLQRLPEIISPTSENIGDIFISRLQTYKNLNKQTVVVKCYKADKVSSKMIQHTKSIDHSGSNHRTPMTTYDH